MLQVDSSPARRHGRAGVHDRVTRGNNLRVIVTQTSDQEVYMNSLVM